MWPVYPMIDTPYYSTSKKRAFAQLKIKVLTFSLLVLPHLFHLVDQMLIPETTE